MDYKPEPEAHQLPIPQRPFSLYINFWHLIYLGTLFWVAVRIGLDWWHNGHAVNWQPAVLLLLLLIQAGLYLKFIVFNLNWGKGWPLPAPDLWLYFGGTLACWMVEWQIMPDMFWLVGVYIGQFLGITPPVAAIPATTGLYMLIQWHVGNFTLSILQSGELISFVTSWVSCMVIYFFIWYLIRTSRERGQLVTELQRAQQQLALAHEKELELATLRERERLARDLHDSLGHALVTMSVQLEAIQRLYRVDPERGSTHVNELKSLVRRSMDELRRSLAGLRAPGLGERSLSAALQSLAVEVSERTGLTISCQVPSEADTLRPALAETLWRVAQEALTNVEKHAQARSVELILDLEAQQVILRVVDDGIGKAENGELSPGHYGLRGLRERVEGLGGIFTVENRTVGVEVTASIPLL